MLEIIPVCDVTPVMLRTISQEIVRGTIQLKQGRAASCYSTLCFLVFTSQLSVTTMTMTMNMTIQVFSNKILV